MNKQIIVTKDNYGIEIFAQLVDANKNVVNITGQTVEVVIVDDTDTIIDTIEAQHIDSSNGIASITLEKEHTATLGLYKTYWSSIDSTNNVTAQDDIFYYCKDKNGGAVGETDNDNNFDNEDILDKFKDIDNELNEIKEALKRAGIEI